MSVYEHVEERLERHPLPQSTLSRPLFLGVEAPVVGFEAIVMMIVINATGFRFSTVVLVGAVLVAFHTGLAMATRRDERLTLVYSRSHRYPKRLAAAATLGSLEVVPEPTFPRKEIL